VSAVDKGTGRKQSIVIKSSSGLKEEEIKRMVKEAEEHADEDREKRGLIEERNKAESLILTVERLVKDSGDKITDAEKKTLEEAKKTLEKERETAKTASDLGKAVEAFEKEVHAVSERLYRAAAEAQAKEEGPTASEDRAKGKGPPRAGAGKGGKDDGVIDADFDVKQ
jgi:molecular chaperone DnaK